MWLKIIFFIMDRDVVKGNKLCYKKETERMKLIHKHNL